MAVARTLVGVVGLCGWTVSLHGQVAFPRKTGERLPVLGMAMVSKAIETSPLELQSAVRVGPQGVVLFESDRSFEQRLVLVDSSGSVMARFGKVGSGPGEVRSPWPVAVTSDAVLVWDGGQNRLSVWDLSGKAVRTVLTERVLAPAVGSSHGLLAILPDSGRTRPVLVDIATGGIVPLLGPDDQFFKREFATPTTAGVLYAPTLGVWSGGFLLGNPNSYRVGEYTWKGQLVRSFAGDPASAPVSAKRAEAAVARVRKMLTGRVPESRLAEMATNARKGTLPAFSPASPISEDAMQRLWVLGIAGDSAFADVFSKRGYVGRVGIHCPGFEGRWSLSGMWLALVCQSDDEDYLGEAVVRLFRLLS